MSKILHRFKLELPDYKHGVLYAELEDNIYSKVFYDGNNLKVEYIDIKEYASALAHITLRIIPNG